MLAPLGRVEGVRLVAVEAVEAEAGERVERRADAAPSGMRDDIGPPGRDLGPVRELLALEELVPGHDRHRGDASLIAAWYPAASRSRARTPAAAPGIQADLKAFAALGCHGMSAIVALTAQSTIEVRSVHEAAAGVHPRRARGRVRRHRRRRGEDGDALLAADHRDRRGLSRRPSAFRSSSTR